MGEEKKSSKDSCRKAMESVELELMKLPRVVGLGVVKAAADAGHKVALYVSKQPQTAKERKALPQTISVPDSEEEVDIEILEIGEVKKEALESPEPPPLGKEPL